MTEYVPLRSPDSSKIPPGKMRDVYNQERLHSWEFEEIKDTADARTEIKVKLNLEGEGKISREPTMHVFFIIDKPESG